MLYCKTAAGKQEIEQRSRKLSASLRSILLMVDGRRSEADLMALIASLHAPADALQQLQALWLIELQDAQAVADVAQPPVTFAPAGRYSTLLKLVNETIRAHLGLKGYFLQIKAENCFTLQDLEALLPDVAEALSKAKSDALGRRWLADARVAGL